MKLFLLVTLVSTFCLAQTNFEKFNNLSVKEVREGQRKNAQSGFEGVTVVNSMVLFAKDKFAESRTAADLKLQVSDCKYVNDENSDDLAMPRLYKINNCGTKEQYTCEGLAKCTTQHKVGVYFHVKCVTDESDKCMSAEKCMAMSYFDSFQKERPSSIYQGGKQAGRLE